MLYLYGYNLEPMKLPVSDLRRKRDQILEQIQSIDRLRRGSLSEQFFTRKVQGQEIRQGPYFVLQCYLKGCKCSERIPADQAEQTKLDVANYQRFQELAEEFVQITDRITQVEGGHTHAKKNSSRRRLPKSSSEKHGLS